ncbi:thioredoxin [Candidatus Woesearchaeota archaeon]|nr:thioredoxin [Candidatus Woesearchaeota archaeon]
MVNELNDETFAKNIAKGNVVVDFYADWCGPCQLMKPMFEKLAGEVKNITFFKVNVDKCQKAAQEHDVRSIPTFALFKNGEEIDQISGVISEGDFKKKLKAVFG